MGPLHGGANEACVNMLRKIADDGGNVKKYVDMAKDKASNFRLMGFGHRVYKNYDPRAKIIKAACDTLLAKLKLSDPLFEVAQKLEETALKDPYFIERKTLSECRFLFGSYLSGDGDTGSDVYGLVCNGPLAGMDRSLVEMQNSPTTRINRPRQIYTVRPFAISFPSIGVDPG